MKCFYCDNPIKIEEKYTIFPLDKPYVNLFLHQGECYSAVSPEYVKDNISKVMTYMESKKKK